MLHSDNSHPLTSHPALRKVLMLWLAFALAVAVKTLLSPDRHTVYPKMAARAIAWWSGRDLYADYEGLGRFPYSPAFAIVATPFAVLGNRAGAVLWVWVSIVVYVWGVRRLARDVLPGSWPPPREALLLILAMIGAIRGFWNAQSNALIIGLLMLGASAMVRRRWCQAACLLGATPFIKLWAAAIVLLVAALVPRKLAPRIAAVCLIGAALPFLTQPPDVVVAQYRSWGACLVEMSGEIQKNYRDLWTIFGLLGAKVPRPLYTMAQAAAALAALAWCLWLQRKGLSPGRLLAITLSAGTAWAMVLGPGVEYNTFVMLAPMVSWAVLESLESRKGRAVASAAFLMTMLLGAGAIERTLKSLSSAAVAMLPLGTLVFVVWLVFFAASADRTAAPGSPPRSQARVPGE